MEFAARLFLPVGACCAQPNAGHATRAAKVKPRSSRARREIQPVRCTSPLTFFNTASLCDRGEFLFIGLQIQVEDMARRGEAFEFAGIRGRDRRRLIDHSIEFSVGPLAQPDEKRMRRRRSVAVRMESPRVVAALATVGCWGSLGLKGTPSRSRLAELFE